MRLPTKRYEISLEQLLLLKQIAEGISPYTPNTHNWAAEQLLAIISSIKDRSPDAFVRAWLSDGPKRIRVLKAYATSNGIRAADLQRSLKRHADRRKEGFGGKWYYVLRKG